MATKRFDWRAALNDAINAVRAQASFHGDWYAGYKAGASSSTTEW